MLSFSFRGMCIETRILKSFSYSQNLSWVILHCRGVQIESLKICSSRCLHVVEVALSQVPIIRPLLVYIPLHSLVREVQIRCKTPEVFSCNTDTTAALLLLTASARLSLLLPSNAEDMCDLY